LEKSRRPQRSENRISFGGGDGISAKWLGKGNETKAHKLLTKEKGGVTGAERGGKPKKKKNTSGFNRGDPQAQKNGCMQNPKKKKRSRTYEKRSYKAADGQTGKRTKNP